MTNPVWPKEEQYTETPTSHFPVSDRSSVMETLLISIHCLIKQNQVYNQTLKDTVLSFKELQLIFNIDCKLQILVKQAVQIVFGALVVRETFAFCFKIKSDFFFPQ